MAQRGDGPYVGESRLMMLLIFACPDLSLHATMALSSEAGASEQL